RGRRRPGRPPPNDGELPLRARRPRARRARAGRRRTSLLSRSPPLRHLAAARRRRGEGASRDPARPGAARAPLHDRPSRTAPRGAVPALPDADHEDPRRRTRNVVLPDLSGGSAIELATELDVAADWPPVDHDLRHRPPARELEHGLSEVLVLVQPDLLVFEPARVEQRLRPHAIAAPARRIDLDRVHYQLKRIQPAIRSRP